MSKTLFEKIASREISAEILHEDELCLVIRDIHPQAPTHLLVVPLKPIPRLGEATAEDQATLGHLLLVAGRMARDLGLSEIDQGFRIVINHGRNGGESVPHLHVHVLGGRPLQWPPG